MIPITRPFSPPIEEYQELLKGIWERNWFTNNGPLVIDLELKLKRYLGCKHLLYVGNGTIAIQIALKALNITREVITTPFSYVATTSSLVWEGCTPVFVDIDPYTFNIDPTKIEAAITDDTQAILATHCFGNPCDVEAIKLIADKHGLKVVYDAAHCFGTKYKGESIFNWGDLSTTSFHATKLFHTIEGGAIFTKNSDLLKQLEWRRNFGHNGPDKYHGVGINGKNSEFHAAMGLTNLKYVENILNSRKKQSDYYDSLLSNTTIIRPKIHKKSVFNYAYHPVLFQNEIELVKVKNALEKNNIYPRRYFYPSLDQLNYVVSKVLPVTKHISDRVLCLPLFYDLKFSDIEKISNIIITTLKKI